VGKGRTIIHAFHNLLVGSILPVRRRRKKTLEMIAKEMNKQ
jgi:hypothetical protein